MITTIISYLGDQRGLRRIRDFDLEREAGRGPLQDIHIRAMFSIKNDLPGASGTYRFRASDMDADPLVR